MRLSGGTSRQGTLTQVTDEGTCGAAATSSAWRGTKSTQVYELRRKSRKRSALIGTAIGAGAGAILGAAGSSSCGQGENLFPCGRGSANANDRVTRKHYTLAIMKQDLKGTVTGFGSFWLQKHIVHQLKVVWNSVQ